MECGQQIAQAAADMQHPRTRRYVEPQQPGLLAVVVAVAPVPLLERWSCGFLLGQPALLILLVN